MKKLIILIPLFFINYSLLFSQVEFKIKVDDFIWIGNEEYNSIDLMVMLTVTNTGNTKGICYDLNNIRIGSSDKNYKYGRDLKFDSFSGFFDREIEPDDYEYLSIIFSVPKDADNLKLYFEASEGGDSKYLTESFNKWRTNNSDYDKFLIEARESFSNGDYIECIVSYQKALIVKPDLKINFQLANAWVMIGSYENAIDYYIKSFNDDVEKELIYNNLGYSYFEKGYYNDAIENFVSAFDIDKKHWDAALGAAISYYELGDYTDAKRCFEIAAEIEKKLYQGIKGLENLIENGGYFYTGKQINSINNLYRYLGYEHYK